MTSLDTIINESKDAREVKRALSVKMVESGIKPATVSKLLNVSPQYISKWKVKYETEGAESLLLGYEGRQSYLNEDQKAAVIEWIKKHETLSVEALQDHIVHRYGIAYQSKKSYYDLLVAAGMSYYKNEKQNTALDSNQRQTRSDIIKKTGVNATKEYPTSSRGRSTWKINIIFSLRPVLSIRKKPVPYSFSICASQTKVEFYQ